MAAITLPRDTATIIVGTTIKLTAIARSSSGQVLDRSVVWKSFDLTRATVSSDGAVTGVAVGTVTVTATVDDVSAGATITVVAPPVESISLDVSSLSIYAGVTRQIVATVKDVNGNIVTDRVVTWSSSSNSVVAVTSAGVVTSSAFGTATITASVDGKNATVTVAVKHDPILFVHGFASSGQIWGTMIGRLLTDGWIISDLTNWSYDTSISNATTAGLIKLKVDSISAATGAPKVDIITHSMGALSARYYAKNLGGSDKIDAWVSLGGPNHGTSTANFCGLTPCIEMRPESAFLTSLNAGDETPGVARYGTWWTPCDQITTPPTSVVLSGATNTETSCLGHSDLYQDATVYSQVRDFIR